MKWFRAQDYYNTGYPEGWRGRVATEGGSLANQAVHYLDLLQGWLGPVESVFGRRRRYLLLTSRNIGKAKRVAINAPISR